MDEKASGWIQVGSDPRRQILILWLLGEGFWSLKMIPTVESRLSASIIPLSVDQRRPRHINLHINHHCIYKPPLYSVSPTVKNIKVWRIWRASKTQVPLHIYRDQYMEEMDNVGAEQCLVVHKVDVKGKIGVKHTTPQHVHCSGQSRRA